MPWDVSDVSRHTKKAKTQAQKKKWVSIANSVLKDCLKGDESTKVCESRAIKIANSKFMQEIEMTIETKKEKMPLGALQFVDRHGFAKAVGDDNERLEMTIYTGRVIIGHWWWGNLVLDLDGMSFPKSKYPILENHMADRKIAFGGKPIKENYTLKAAPNAQFVDTEESREFRKLSKEGFPYEASIYAQPTRIQRIDEDETAEVNGFSFKGPGVIWRKSIFKESSVCVFGWDSKTSAKAFSREVELSIEEECPIDKNVQLGAHAGEHKKGGEEKMTLDELKKDEKLYNEMKTEIRGEMQSEMDTKNKGFETSIKDLEIKLSESATKLSESDGRVEALENESKKRKTMQIEADLKNKAEGIVQEKLSESQVPERLHAKIVSLTNYSQFMKDEKVEDFEALVDADIKDWEKLGMNASIAGLSVTLKDETTAALVAKEDAADEEIAEKLFKTISTKEVS